MKIRIHDNSVRLRLDRNEVDQIGRGESVDCATRFATGSIFNYRLSVADVTTVTGDFSSDCIAVRLPRDVARHWSETETEVSIDIQEPIKGGFLRMLIEKDFECLEPREGESQSNRFSNPKALN